MKTKTIIDAIIVLDKAGRALRCGNLNIAAQMQLGEECYGAKNLLSISLELDFPAVKKIADCRKRERMLSAWDADFLDSIENRLNERRTLSTKQIEKLDEIWEKATSKG